MAARGLAAETRRMLRDPALLVAVVVLWLLLALFVLYPLADIAPNLEVPGLGTVERLRERAVNRGIERL